MKDKRDSLFFCRNFDEDSSSFGSSASDSDSKYEGLFRFARRTDADNGNSRSAFGVFIATIRLDLEDEIVLANEGGANDVLRIRGVDMSMHVGWPNDDDADQDATQKFRIPEWFFSAFLR